MGSGILSNFILHVGKVPDRISAMEYLPLHLFDFFVPILPLQSTM